MGYAKYIGRVGALAVTLGQGVAVANAPGRAHAGSTASDAMRKVSDEHDR
jgi:hypothetical protein